MRFGPRIRELRKAKNLSLRALAEAVGVSFTYISKIENEKLDFGDYPGEDLIAKLATALDVEADELLILEWWIAGGLAEGKTVAEAGAPREVLEAVARLDSAAGPAAAGLVPVDPASSAGGVTRVRQLWMRRWRR